jgi:hypothetical protein
MTKHRLSRNEIYPVVALRRLTQTHRVQAECELCSAALPANHRHLLEMARGQIICACDACALRFRDGVGRRFKLIPRDLHALPDFQIADEQWDSLGLPINLVFFFYSTLTKRIIAVRPSPDRATESLLPEATWQTLAAENPALARLRPDVQALLINRVGAVPQYLLAPIDTCYELVGLIRLHWRGPCGGDAVWEKIDAFFARMKNRSTPVFELEASHA